MIFDRPSFWLHSSGRRTDWSRDTWSFHGERHRTERNRHSTAVYQEMCLRGTRNTGHCTYQVERLIFSSERCLSVFVYGLSKPIHRRTNNGRLFPVIFVKKTRLNTFTRSCLFNAYAFARRRHRSREPLLADR